MNLKESTSRCWKRHKICKEIRQLRRHRNDLAVEHAILTYDASPDDSPLWIHQEIDGAGHPLRVAIEVIDEEILQLQLQLVRL